MEAEFKRIAPYRGKWVGIVYINGERKRLSLGNLNVTGSAESCANYKAAERAANGLKQQFAQPVGDTCKDIYEAYLKDRQVSEKPLIDKERIENAWKALAGHFGHLQVHEVTRETCRAYIKQRRGIKRQDGTIRKELGVLSAALNWFDEEGPQELEFPLPPPPKDLWINREQFTQLLEAAKDTFHLTVFLHLAIATAGRKEALLTMKWTQVKWEREEVWLGVKRNGKKRATVPMTPTLKSVLQLAKKIAMTETVIEFEGAAVKSVRTSLARACRKAGLWRLTDEGKFLLDKKGKRIPLVTPHVIRHSAGVWMAAAGRPVEEICDFMGHSGIGVTKRVYAKYRPEHLRAASAALDVGQCMVAQMNQLTLNRS